MRDHTRLRAFGLVDELALLIYQMTRSFPKEEIYGLTAQMRRAAVSAASNIVEGCARETQSEYVRFLTISFGSLRELHYQVSLSRRLGYLSEPGATECGKKLDEAERVLGALIRSMRQEFRQEQEPYLQEKEPLTSPVGEKGSGFPEITGEETV